MKRLLLLALFIVTCVSCGPVVTTVYAQTFPVLKTLAWDANPAGEGVTNYTVKMDGVTIGSPTGTTQALSIATAGAHTVTVVAVNLWGTSSPATLNLNVIAPSTPVNPRLQ